MSEIEIGRTYRPPVTEADVREIIREDRRRLAAKLREMHAQELEEARRKADEAQSMIVLTSKWPKQLADILEADDD